LDPPGNFSADALDISMLKIWRSIAKSNQKQYRVKNMVKYLLIYLSRYFDQETGKKPFQSSSQANTTYYLPNHSKVRGNPVKPLPKDTISEFAAVIFSKSL